MKTVLFIRHGETELNRDGDRFCGDLDPDLSPVGIAQVRTASRVLSRLAAIPQVGWTSPRRRARQTAELLPAVRDWRIEEDLRELSFGTWEGLTKEECRQRDALAFDAWVQNPHHHRPGSGESGRDAQPRIKSIIFRIEQERCETLAIVSHKSFLRFLLCSLLGIPPASARQRLRIKNGTVSIVELHRGGAMLTMLNGCPVE